jgi:hypothetical protein
VIPCPNCTFVNPLGTRFCRSCGERIEVKLSQVAESVTKTNKSNRETSLVKAGMSSLTLGGFLLVAAIIFRCTLVPDVPAPDLPPVAMQDLIPETFGKPQASATTAATVGPRLSWRRNQGTAMLAAVGVDRDRLKTWQTSVRQAQKDDGSFGGSDQLMATALGALALQSAPDPEQLAAAAKARAWLKGHAKDIAGRTGLTRSLVLAALIDAEDMPPDVLTANQGYLVDDQAPQWQALAIAMLPSIARHTEHTTLRNNSQDGLWTGWWDAVENKPGVVSDTALATVDTNNLVTGEDRMMWAHEAWFLAASGDDYTRILEGWSRTDPAPVNADLLAKTGPWAPAAVAIITMAAPLRMPPLALSAP